MKKRFIETGDIPNPLQYLANILRKRQVNDDSEMSESTSELFEFGNQQEPEEKPEFVSPMEIRNIVDDTNMIIGEDKEANKIDEVPKTGLLDFDEEDIFKAKNISNINQSKSEINLDDDDDTTPLFYEGESESKEEAKDEKKKKKKKKAKLNSNMMFTLTSKDLTVNFGEIKNTIKPPED